MFIAETPIVIGRALESGSKPLSFFVKDKNIENEEIQNLLKRAGDPDTFSAPLDVINNITGFNLTRGVLAAFLRPPLPDPDALLS